VRILIVDDQKHARQGLMAILRTELPGVLITEAADGAEAVRRAREGAPQLIIMDISMPVLDGIAATLQIKAFDPRIMILAHSLDAGAAPAARAAGADAFVGKGEPAAALLAAVRGLLAGAS
jgi:DNA-binding NarL/FixJ family response regulator